MSQSDNPTSIRPENKIFLEKLPQNDALTWPPVVSPHLWWLSSGGLGMRSAMSTRDPIAPNRRATSERRGAAMDCRSMLSWTLFWATMSPFPPSSSPNRYLSSADERESKAKSREGTLPAILDTTIQKAVLSPTNVGKCSEIL